MKWVLVGSAAVLIAFLNGLHAVPSGADPLKILRRIYATDDNGVLTASASLALDPRTDSALYRARLRAMKSALENGWSEDLASLVATALITDPSLRRFLLEQVKTGGIPPVSAVIGALIDSVLYGFNYTQRREILEVLLEKQGQGNFPSEKRGTFLNLPELMSGEDLFRDYVLASFAARNLCVSPIIHAK